MNKKVYIIHGWGMDSNMPWIKWLEKELPKRNVEVHAYDMPNSKKPTIKEWVSYLEAHVENIDEHTYFIGHSIGAQTILRFLEKSHKHLRVGGCVFVAPWIDLIGLNSEELKIAQPWLNNKIDFSRVEDHVGKIACVFSADDPFVSKKEWEKFEKELGAKIIIKQKMGHFEDTKKIEEILHEIK